MYDNIIKEFRDLTMHYSNSDVINHNVMRAITIIAALNTYKEYNVSEDEYVIVNAVYDNYLDFRDKSEILNTLYYRLLELFRNNRTINDITLLVPFNTKVYKLYLGLIDELKEEQK